MNNVEKQVLDILCKSNKLGSNNLKKSQELLQKLKPFLIDGTPYHNEPNPFADGFINAMGHYMVSRGATLSEASEIAAGVIVTFNDLYPHTSLYARLNRKIH